MKRGKNTNQLAADTGIELFDGTPVRVRGHGALRGPVGSTVKGVDRLREAQLRRGHGCICGLSALGNGGSGESCKRTAHRVEVGLPVFL